MASPTARTLKFLRDNGYTAQVVERYCQYSKRRIDLFGFIDVVAIRPDDGTIGVQATTGDHHNERVEKILNLAAAKTWIKSGNAIWVISWAKKGPRGKAKRWTERVQEITLKMFDEAKKAE